MNEWPWPNMAINVWCIQLWCATSGSNSANVNINVHTTLMNQLLLCHDTLRWAHIARFAAGISYTLFMTIFTLFIQFQYTAWSKNKGTSLMVNLSSYT